MITIAEKFSTVFKGQTNFITPNIVDYFQIGNYLLESSMGTFLGKRLFGVTILEERGEELIHRTDLGKCFTNENEAMLYITTFDKQCKEHKL